MILKTTVINAPRLAKQLGAKVLVASETFQHTGSFKFRAAYTLVKNIPHPLVIAASSGNFGQALAYACSLAGKSCIVVMPKTSATVKVDAVREYGANVEFVDVNVMTREDKISQLAKLYPEAYLASAYDDPLVIEGNSTLGMELASLDVPIDDVIVPIGGGGLSAGVIQGISRSGRKISVVGAEPLMANDAARSLREGRIVQNEKEPATIADGARTISLGKRNWEILRTGLKNIVEVQEEAIAQAVRLLFELANLKAEPTGALSVAALLTEPEMFRHRHVCCIVSGGNVDPAIYAAILAPTTTQFRRICIVRDLV